VGAMRNYHLAVQQNQKKYMKKTARPAATQLTKEEKVREPAVAVNKLFHKKSLSTYMLRLTII